MANEDVGVQDKTKKKTKKAKVRLYQKKIKGDSESVAIKKLIIRYENIDVSTVKTFSELPLSPSTQRGLKDCSYMTPTSIQKETIRLALQGMDVLGAAKTGSGKTLAFLVPILESLYRKQWTHLDGLGALVITPTRELAYQIFETLRKVGSHHDFSAGLIIGGKDLKFERKRMDQCNIVIGTPGRLLQHMDENPLFECTNMQVLVLDEADRCLDMGFSQTMNAIVANLPSARQTLLFSATQTRSVRDLARLSLVDPSYVSVDEHSVHSTPDGLEQTYTVCELHEKLSVVYSFVRNHLKQKVIVFFSSCKQVKYMYEVFCRLRPGISLLALYGSLHQLRRMDIYESFTRKQSAVLFATDLAARGLDFPDVHWVVQADCPEDTDTYIHRVGRTARYQRGGHSLLLLLPSEKKHMLSQLEKAKIPISDTQININRIQNPVRKMEALLARDVSLKDTAQRAFVAYVKSVFMMKNKSVFDVQSLDTDAYARSLGLAIPPRIRFLQRLDKKKNAQQKTSTSVKTSSSGKISVAPHYVTQINDEALEPARDEVENGAPQQIGHEDSDDVDNDDDDDDDEDDGILMMKRRDHDIDNPLSAGEKLLMIEGRKSKKPLTKAAVAKKLLKKKIVPNKKITFDDDGEAVYDNKSRRSEMARTYELEDGRPDGGGIDIERARLVLREEDKFDKQRFREQVKAKHKMTKKKLKEERLMRRYEQEQDNFGESGSEEEGPDLSWLPDPDKVFGKKDCEEPERYEDEVEEEEQITKQILKSKKRKKSLTEVQKPPKSKKRKSNIDVQQLSVNETEELALMLLSTADNR